MMPLPAQPTNDAIAFETLRFSISLVRKARAAMHGSSFENSCSESEVNFHLGCAEIALLRLLIEEERTFNGGGDTGFDD